MSFLGSLVNSIGGEKAPEPPAKPIPKPLITNPVPSNVSKSAPPTPSTAPIAKPNYKGTAGLGGLQPSGSLKRKADEVSTDRPVKISKPTLQTNSDSKGQATIKTNGVDIKSPIIPARTNSPIVGPSSTNSATAASSKAPAKGSYAAILARAKEAQQTKTPSQIGVIKHQSVEKIKASKLAERKRQNQEKAKPVSGEPSAKSSSGKADNRRRSASPVKKGDPAVPKQAKTPRPPLHGPAPASTPSYKGTMNQAPKKSKQEVQQKKRSRYDDYLGTDEEDEDDDGYGYGDGEDYYSDESDDVMEGGFDELEEEERRAERAAREDDARELALEAKLKKEKLERKQKLTALAQKKR